jgi:hypothetical protein
MNASPRKEKPDMGRLHKNLEDPSVPVWVCAVCGRPEKEKVRGCKHADDDSYALISETNYRDVQKEFQLARLTSIANKKGALSR